MQRIRPLLPLRGLFVLVLLSAAGCTSSNSNADAGTETIDGSIVPGVDASTACPAETHVCLSPPPQLWSGPVARASAGESEVLPECGSNYAIEEWHVFSDITAEGDCSCSCATVATGVACSGARLQGYRQPIGNLAPCTSQPVGAETVLTPRALATDFCSSAALTSVAGGAFVQTTPGNVVLSGSCGLGNVSDDFQPATFDSEDRFCATNAASGGSCEGVAICAPRADEGFADELCIYREGEHECPAGSPFSEHFVRHQGLADDRACDTCSCAGPSGGQSCGGRIEMGRTPAPTNSCASTVSTGSCEPDPWPGTSAFMDVARYKVDFNDPNVFGCSATGGELVGEAAGINPVTFCCQG